ncbi:MAG TPA: cytochrome c [Polyangiaceae bacterium]|nr:cytochrome c [Polyangiaceae bacterium]
MGRRFAALNFALVCLASFATGCRGETSRESPIVPIRNMYHQPRYNMQNESEYFDDQRTMRSPVEGVISREEEVDPRIARGRSEDDSAYVAVVPNEEIARHGGMEALVKRGQDRFNIYCTPCHDKTGAGAGMIVKHGMLQPPSFHQDRLRHAPDGQIFATISNGVRNMPAYGPQIPVDDRWAIVSYVRALQLSQAQIAAETKP